MSKNETRGMFDDVICEKCGSTMRHINKEDARRYHEHISEAWSTAGYAYYQSGYFIYEEENNCFMCDNCVLSVMQEIDRLTREVIRKHISTILQDFTTDNKIVLKWDGAATTSTSSTSLTDGYTLVETDGHTFVDMSGNYRSNGSFSSST